MQWLKQSTVATVIVGPVLDSAGAEFTTLVLADLNISKNGGTPAAITSGTLTHVANGWYTLAFATGNVDTLGRLDVICVLATKQLPPKSLMVLPAMVFDSMVLGTDVMQSDVTQLLGTAWLAPGTAGTPDINVKLINAVSTSAVTTVKAVQGLAVDGVITTLTNLPAITTDWLTSAGIAADAVSEIQSGLATAANLATVAGYLDTEIAAILADTNELQTDWANGGRLDLIIDATSTQVSVNDLPTNTELATALGTSDDAVLAAIAAEAVKTAAIKVVTDRIDTGLVADGGVYQFTANMLELGPGGAGGALETTSQQILTLIAFNSPARAI